MIDGTVENFCLIFWLDVSFDVVEFDSRSFKGEYPVHLESNLVLFIYWMCKT